MLMIGDRDTDIQCAENFNISSILYNGIDNLFSLSDNIIKKLESNAEKITKQYRVFPEKWICDYRRYLYP